MLISDIHVVLLTFLNPSVLYLQGRSRGQRVPGGDRQEDRQVQGAALAKVSQGAARADGGAGQEARWPQVCAKKIG